VSRTRARKNESSPNTESAILGENATELGVGVATAGVFVIRGDEDEDGLAKGSAIPESSTFGSRGPSNA
jgi:hypothetical protein